jgi:hypothetical protein
MSPTKLTMKETHKVLRWWRPISHQTLDCILLYLFKKQKMRGLYIIKIWIRTIRRKDIIETTPIRQFRSSPPIRLSPPWKKNDGIRCATYLRVWAWKERMNKCRGLRMGATIVYIVVSWSSRFWPNQPSAIRVNSSSL